MLVKFYLMLGASPVDVTCSCAKLSNVRVMHRKHSAAATQIVTDVAELQMNKALVTAFILKTDCDTMMFDCQILANRAVNYRDENDTLHSNNGTFKHGVKQRAPLCRYTFSFKKHCGAWSASLCHTTQLYREAMHVYAASGGTRARMGLHVPPDDVM
jgi:hypothetical protein